MAAFKRVTRSGRRADARVVVTGFGMVTPLGRVVEDVWASLVLGRSSVSYVKRFDASAFPTTFAAEIPDGLACEAPEPPITRVLDRKDRMGWLAAIDALDHASMQPGSITGRCGIAIGTERRRPDLFERIASGASYDSSFDHLRNAPFALPAVLAAARGLHGPQFVIAAACASGAQAIGVAYETLRRGDADAMLAGGCDSLVDPVMLAGFSGLGLLSRRNDAPERASRPFDKARDGFVLGEGAGMVVLERREHALARGTPIYGEILGYSSSCSGYRMTDPPIGGQGLCQAMQGALEDAGLQPADVDCVNAHGTSTLQSDRSETASIKLCFGPRARDVPITATKSMTGHMVCASGAVEVIVSVLTVLHGIIPPTINYESPDPECDLDYVPNIARHSPVDVVMSNSAGFGGVNAAVIVRRHADEL